MFFYIDSNYKVCGNAGQYRFKRGDDLELCLIFIGEKGYPVDPEFLDVVFGAKLPGDYDGNFLAYTNEFVPGQTSEGDPCLKGVLKLNSSELTTSMGTEDYKELSAEFEFNRLNAKSSSQTISLYIHNDLIKGVEGIPAGTVPDYVTKSYVDTAVSELVSEAMAEDVFNISGIRDEAVLARNGAEEACDQSKLASEEAGVKSSIAAEKAEEAMQFSREALSSRDAAAGSALSAAGSAEKVLDIVAGVEGYAEQAAAGARDSADSAAAAMAAKNTAQGIADSLGNEVAEAGLARDQAQASAASAADNAAVSVQKALEAAAAVAGIGNSVLNAQAAAGAAQASADGARVSASSAALKAESAGAGAAQAAMSATNAAQSEDMAREKAAGAADSAERAEQSAVSANLSAEDVRRIAAEVLTMISEIVPPRLNYDGNHFYFNHFTEPESPEDLCVYPYSYLKKKVGGKDNYQLWLEAGNTGTLEDFMESIKGPPGDGEELQEVKDQLQSKSEVIMMTEDEYEALADKAPNVLYAII